MKHCYHLIIELAEKYLPLRYLCIRCGKPLEHARREDDRTVESAKDLNAIYQSGGSANDQSEG